MLLQSKTALCKAPGGAWSTWMYLNALARATEVSRKTVYGFRNELHFANVGMVLDNHFRSGCRLQMNHCYFHRGGFEYT